jgi:hypothetical protein
MREFLRWFLAMFEMNCPHRDEGECDECNDARQY